MTQGPTSADKIIMSVMEMVDATRNEDLSYSWMKLADELLKDYLDAKKEQIDENKKINLSIEKSSKAKVNARM